jgi:Fe-S cluster biosynthesis and repair protein YggX
MSRTVHCQLLGKDLPGLEFQPYPGDLGKRIFDNVSAEAWQQWLSHQTMLINEHRLSPINPEHRKYLEEQMERFFFIGDAEQPEGYVPED